MFKKTFVYAIILLGLSILVSQNYTNATDLGDGWTLIGGGYAEGCTEDNTGDVYHEYLSVSTSVSFVETINGNQVVYSGSASGVNNNAIAVSALVELPAASNAEYGYAYSNHYIKDGNDSWSGTSSVSYFGLYDAYGYVY